MKRYEIYKDSGVEWESKIPSNWSVKKLGYIGNFTASGIDKKISEDELPVKIINYTDVYGNKNKTIDSSFNFMVVTAKKERIVEHSVNKGDLIFTPTSESTEEIGLSALVTEDLEETAFSYHVLRFQFKDEVDINFRKYLCNNHFVLNQFSIRAQGITRYTLRRSDFKNTMVFLPSPQEQTQIANYLDYKTGLIDNIIAQKEELIQKLKEQRQAIINEAVTKGLNPNAKLKDSGIEWLGEIPEHWEVVKLKFLGESITGITYSPGDVSETGTLVLRSSNIQKGKLALRDTVYVNKIIADKYVTQKGDILLCSRNGSRRLIGKNIILDERVENQTWGAFMTVYRSDYNDFMYYFFNSDIFSALSSLFLSSTINQLTIGVLNNMQIAFPKDKLERQLIIDALKSKTGVINKIISLNNKQIQKLKEYRQSLISEAVTGKIDVRDWQAPKS